MGKIFIIGLGPGGADFLTAEALSALSVSDVLCGYTVYIDLIAPLFPHKEIYTTPMTQELQRCQWCIDSARSGKTVAMVCSGDAGVYGMAGPVLELLGEDTSVEVSVVSGVTAALSGGAVLGAPLMHDFCVISLSDLLTPWQTIEKRLDCAAQGDFSICLYNPRSKKRRDHLTRACDILMAHKSPETICGWVRHIGRQGQESATLTLSELRDADLDMFTTVFVGSSSTRLIGGRMVTPRGYENK